MCQYCYFNEGKYNNSYDFLVRSGIYIGFYDLLNSRPVWRVYNLVGLMPTQKLAVQNVKECRDSSMKNPKHSY